MFNISIGPNTVEIEIDDNLKVDGNLEVTGQIFTSLPTSILDCGRLYRDGATQR